MLVSTLEPVVVKPATDSKMASTGDSAPVVGYGSAPKREARNQALETITKPSRGRIRRLSGRTPRAMGRPNTSKIRLGREVGRDGLPEPQGRPDGEQLEAGQKHQEPAQQLRRQQQVHAGIPPRGARSVQQLSHRQDRERGTPVGTPLGGK